MKPKLEFRSFSLKKQEQLKQNPLGPINKVNKIKEEQGIPSSIIDVNTERKAMSINEAPQITKYPILI